MAKQDPPEFLTVQRHIADIKSRIMPADLTDFSSELLQAGLIINAAHGDAIAITGLGPRQKIASLITEAMEMIRTKPDLFNRFADILERRDEQFASNLRSECHDASKSNDEFSPPPTKKARTPSPESKSGDFLRGVEVCAETILEVVGDKAQKVEWPGHGFYIDVPEGALLPGVTASVRLKVILTGQFKLPENRQLISAFYWVSSSEMFLKHVAVNIQHCAVIENEEQCLDFRFIIAKCSQKELPYTFKEFEGLFNRCTQYATIKLKQFSFLSTTGSRRTKLRCAAFMYYKQHTATPKIADFHFVLVRDLQPHIQEVEKEYQHWKEDDKLRISLKQNAIKLDLKQQQEPGSWEIVAVTNSQISKEDVSGFKDGRIIPHCAFECRLLTKEARIFHKVDIIGATESMFFHIRYSNAEPAKGLAVVTPPVAPILPLSQPSRLIADEVPIMKDLLNKVASKAKDKWKIFGIQLEIGQGQLNTIKHSNPIECYSEIFELWKNKGTPPFTWGTILEALRSPSVEEDALANKVEAWIKEQHKR